MSKEKIIRAWKDPEYRSSLNAHEHSSLPASPAGAIDDGKLAEVAGGSLPFSIFFHCKPDSWGFPCSISWLVPIC
jgi:mersacidin/lichenicidin family type 2 lantibiotic